MNKKSLNVGKESVIMRRFLYYNEDTINSLLAQIESGLILKATNENSVSQSDSVSEGKKKKLL